MNNDSNIMHMSIKHMVINRINFFGNGTQPFTIFRLGVPCTVTHRPALITIICLSRSSPEDPVNLKFRSAHVLHGPMRA